MRTRRREKGFTLIEMVILIVVAGMALPVMMTSFATIASRSVRAESIADISFYSSQMLDEIAARRFIDPDDLNNDALGPNAGEAYPDFNDVDDYNGYVRKTDRYVTTVAVSYAVLADGVWQTASTATDYKLITVTTVDKRNGLSSTMTTLAAR